MAAAPRPRRGLRDAWLGDRSESELWGAKDLPRAKVTARLTQPPPLSLHSPGRRAGSRPHEAPPP